MIHAQNRATKSAVVTALANLDDAPSKLTAPATVYVPWSCCCCTLFVILCATQACKRINFLQASSSSFSSSSTTTPGPTNPPKRTKRKDTEGSHPDGGQDTKKAK
jgi:hypothetical protein